MMHDWLYIAPLQALVMKVGMDSIMASYFALFEVINHSFGKELMFLSKFFRP